MITNYNRNFETDLPPSKRKAMNERDRMLASSRARAEAKRINATLKRELQRQQAIKDGAVEILQGGSVPAQDVLYYVARSEGMALDEWMDKRTDALERELAAKVRKFQTFARSELVHRLEAEEQQLIEQYTKRKYTKRKGVNDE